MRITKESVNFQVQRKTRQMTSLQNASPSIERLSRWTNVLAGSLLFAYFLRITIPAVWLGPISPFVVNFGGYLALLAALIFLLSRRIRFNVAAMFLIGSVILAIPFSIDLETAALKSFLWLLLFIVVGPLFRGLRAFAFRDQFWHWHKTALLGITLLSFVWYIGGLPQYGKGVSGVTLHCMLLGPFAALALIFAAIRAFEERSLRYSLIMFVSLLTCLVSGARSAVLGAVVGVLVIPILRFRSRSAKLLSIIFVLLTAFIVYSVFGFGSLDGAPLFKSENPLERYVNELQQKGMINTREEMWAMRWDEFYANPIVGMGIGVDTGGVKTEPGTVTVEPGSSYLAVLSMTGIAGAFGLGLLLTLLILRVWKNWDSIESVARTEIAAIGMFWAVHAVAEGWIFAGGSILCLFFWLWVGRLSNLGSLKQNPVT